jgi:phospholipid/cholesterol/gamma-HCH transport system substrate-binding protein
MVAVMGLPPVGGRAGGTVGACGDNGERKSAHYLPGAKDVMDVTIQGPTVQHREERRELMAPPLLRGRSMWLGRLRGLVFLVVLLGLVALSIAMYQKAFTPWVNVTLQADRIGNQLTEGADVKSRGVIIGEVRAVRAVGDGAELELRLRPEQAERVPADTRAQIVPTTLFGEKYVSLVFDGQPADESGRPGLGDGAVIAQDDSETAREFAAALDSLLPLLQTLDPPTVSTTLNALSSALRDRGDRIGSNLVLVRDWLAAFNPELDTLRSANEGLVDFNDTLTAGAGDISTLLRELSAVNRNLVRDQDALAAFLRDTTGVAGTAEGFVAENEQRFITLAAESVPNLRLYERYSPQFPCLLDGIARSAELGDTFGGLRSGLHITLEVVDNLEPFVPGDEPEYLDDPGPTCFGLEGEPIRPFPTYRNPDDGHRDGQGLDPRTGRTDGPPPDGPGGPYTYPDQRRKAPQDRGTSTSGSVMPSSAVTYDRVAVGRAVAPALGLQPDEVPDVAVLLFAPVARGTVVAPS